MTSAWFGLSIGLSGLRAAQTMLDTAAHNTANASTVGYSRQRVRLVASPPFSYPAFNRAGFGQLGTGVSVAAVERIRDAFLDAEIRTQVGLAAAWTARRETLARVETILPEPSAVGLSGVLARFWSAWHDVAAEPTSLAARSALVEQASALAIGLNRTARGLADLAAALDGELRDRIGEVNDLAARIAVLNGQIQRVVVTGERANDLEDARDLLLEQLAELVSVRVERQADGTVTVLLGGTDLVAGDTARTIVAGTDGAGHVEAQWSWGDAVELGPGRLAALVELRDGPLAAYRAALDELAAGIADAVNNLHTTGVDATGAAGGAFFTYASGDAAATLAVAAPVAADPRRVAAAAAAGQPGDGSVAAAIAELRSAPIFGSGTQTAADFYAALIGRIGADSRSAQGIADGQSAVVDYLRNRREAVSGVSLDEEAADLIRFQHAYAAAARVITAVDELLDTLINRTGVVGR
jgi:flagellar hook-associated protein 1 FlgK